MIGTLGNSSGWAKTRLYGIFTLPQSLAVRNVVLAPPLIVIVVLLTSSRKIMGARSNAVSLAWITVAVMTGVSLAMSATWKRLGSADGLLSGFPNFVST